jgi:hypothetical protein
MPFVQKKNSTTRAISLKITRGLITNYLQIAMQQKFISRSNKDGLLITLHFLLALKIQMPDQLNVFLYDVLILFHN